MGMKIDCYGIANNVFLKCKEILENDKIKNQNLKPCFATIIVGKNPSSLIYVKNKIKKSNDLGIVSYIYELEENVSEKEILNLIDELNENGLINGIFVQMPLPKHIDSVKITNRIAANKDVDGLNLINLGKLDYSDKTGFVPCTALGIIKILEESKIDLAGKNVAVLGRSLLVGLPTFKLLLQKNATVTVLHSYSKNIKEITKTMDILIVAVGSALMIDESYIKKDAIILDVGINKLEVNGITKTVGDVNFDSVINKSLLVSSVPKGVGLLTVNYLMFNIIKAFVMQNNMQINISI
jgi:methylenetetrahydrofolate dehydrogenase (NADP+)/methenyltetrahydrofolate cyclohydrolase